jgi:hypothetical protein
MKSTILPIPRMPRSSARSPGSAQTASEALEAAGRAASALTVSLGKAIEAIPGGPMRPSALAARLQVSRVLVSRTLGALSSQDPLDALQRLPGPETLRVIVRAAEDEGAPATKTAAANRDIESFAQLIRDSFGTRGALNAAICADRPAMQQRLDYESRQRVFKGMRELRGVEAETWLSSSIVVLDPDDPSKLTVLMIQGFIALRRLRLDVPVAFAFETVGAVGSMKGAEDVPESALHLEDLYTNVPAPLELTEHAGQKIYQLRADRIGKRAVSDMLSVVRMGGWRSRYAIEGRPFTGPFAQPPAPVKTLVFDVLFAPGIVRDARPELFAYAPSYRGGANVNDRTRDIDRVAVPERIEVFEPGTADFDLPEVPKYRQMLERMCTQLGTSLGALRVHRVRVPYPPFGYQFVSTFQLPDPK